MESKGVLLASLLRDVAEGTTKFVGGAFTGSSALVAEGFRSVVDCGNEGLLFNGLFRSRRASEENDPLGYGRELYFWNFVGALLPILMSAGVSDAEEIERIANPRPIEHSVMLGCQRSSKGPRLHRLATVPASTGTMQRLRGRQGQQEPADLHRLVEGYMFSWPQRQTGRKKSAC